MTYWTNSIANCTLDCFNAVWQPYAQAHHNDASFSSKGVAVALPQLIMSFGTVFMGCQVFNERYYEPYNNDGVYEAVRDSADPNPVNKYEEATRKARIVRGVLSSTFCLTQIGLTFWTWTWAAPIDSPADQAYMMFSHCYQNCTV